MTVIHQEVAHAFKKWALCPCLPSPSLFLRPPSILATPSYIIYPRVFIIQQRPQQTNIFVRMICDTMPDDSISTIKGLQTVGLLTLAILVADVL